MWADTSEIENKLCKGKISYNCKARRNIQVYISSATICIDSVTTVYIQHCSVRGSQKANGTNRRCRTEKATWWRWRRGWCANGWRWRGWRDGRIWRRLRNELHSINLYIWFQKIWGSTMLITWLPRLPKKVEQIIEQIRQPDLTKGSNILLAWYRFYQEIAMPLPYYRDEQSVQERLVWDGPVK